MSELLLRKILKQIRRFLKIRNRIKYRSQLLLQTIFLWTSILPMRLFCKNCPKKILLDNSTVGHGVILETCWISTGPELWGGEIEVETGYQALIPVHSPETDTRLYSEIRHLASISHAMRVGLIANYTSDALEIERLTQPIGRYSGYAVGDKNVFEGIERTKLRSFSLVSYLLTDDIKGIFRNQMEQHKNDEPFAELMRYLPKKDSQDAWHIHTTAKKGLDAFLVMDFKLYEKIQSLPETLNHIKDLVMLPSDLTKKYGLVPFDTWVLAYQEDTFFRPRADLHWEGNTRRGKGRKK